MAKGKRYKPEFKDQVTKEALDSSNVPAVAKKFNLPEGTIYSWVSKHNRKPQLEINSKDQEIRRLKKQLEDEKLKNMIMSDLLKKTYQIWEPEKK